VLRDPQYFSWTWSSTQRVKKNNKAEGVEGIPAEIAERQGQMRISLEICNEIHARRMAKGVRYNDKWKESGAKEYAEDFSVWF